MRCATEIELALAPRPSGQTLQRWLYQELRDAMLSGRLPAGVRLPPSRELARQHGVSRGTVLAVYEQLAAEGYLAGTVGRGTTVSASLPGLTKLNPPARSVLVATPPRLSRAGQQLAATPFPLDEGHLPLRAFRPNHPDLSAFPLALWNRMVARRSNALRPAGMGYGPAGGDGALRQAIADHLRYAQRIVCRPEQVLILASAQQGLDLCARLLLDPGDRVWLEDPGYPGARDLFAAVGAQLIAVPVDGLGLDVAAAQALAPDARLAYVTAAHQSPLGMPLAIERRLALLAWARAQGAMVIEDDYDGEFRYHGPPLAALKSLDDDRVIYLGSFSKRLFPALRLAYLVVPESLVDPLTSAMSLTCRQVSPQMQRVLGEFIAEGHFARHLRKMRLRYAERAEVLQQACQQQLAGLLSLSPIHTGLDATALLPAGWDDRQVVAQLLEAGIEARALAFYQIARPPPPGLILGFSAFDGAQIRAGVAGLAQVLESMAIQRQCAG